MSSPLRLLLVTLLLPAASALALEFRVLGWSGPIDDLWLRRGDTVLPVSARERALSPARMLPGSAPVELLRERIVDGRPVREVVATLNPPEGLRRAILVLASDAGRHAGFWIDDDEESHPAGTLRIQNLSAREVALQTGDAPFVLAAGAVRGAAFGDAKRVSIRAAVRQADGGWARAAELSQPVRGHFRVLVLIREGRATPDLAAPPPIELLSFYDYVAPVLAANLPAR